MFAPALVVFFTSGLAALIYQVTWQRVLVIFSGTDVHSATIVVAAFMAGLGCGSLAGGQIADRVSRTKSLALFIVSELAVGMFGFVSIAFFYRFLYGRLGPLGLGLPATSAILFLALLWPTFFMGASLPLLSRALTRSVRDAASTVGWLYAANTLGAAAGAVGATWVLLPLVGMETGAKLAALLNVGCAVSGLGLALWLNRVSEVSAPHVVTAAVSPSKGPSFQRSALLFGLSGFLALSLEIVWFRLLTVMLKPTAFTFGTALAVYLLGLGTGAAIGSGVADRTKRPVLGFFWLQAGAALYAAISLTAFVARLDHTPALAWFAHYYRGYETLDVRAAAQALRAWATGLYRGTASPFPFDFARLYVLCPALLIGPPTAMMGASFPLLQKVAQTDMARLGRRVGLLLAANIIGSTVGAFLTGLLLLDWLGTAGTLRLLAVSGGAFGVLGMFEWLRWQGRGRRLGATALAALAVVVVAAMMPTDPALWSALHGTSPDKIIFSEDGSGLSVLRADTDFSFPGPGGGTYPRVVVFVNGLGQSTLPYGDIHTVLGALPAFIHPHPRQAAIIGLGSGDTVNAMAARRDLERLTSIEIIRPQLATLKALFRRYPYPGLQSVVGAPQIEHVFGDGRLYLTRSARTFDIIEADALRPASAFSGNLYSDTYFELLRDHLAPGGLAISWTPTERVANTFVKVFPYAWWSGQVMIGSNQPIEFDREAVMQRVIDPAVDGYFRWAGIDIVGLLHPYVFGPFRRYGPNHPRYALTDINTDLFPKDEFDLGRPD